MKKFVLLTLIAALLLSAASCGNVPDETTANITSTVENSAPASTQEITFEETTMSPEEIVNILMNTCWLHIADDNGETFAPFQSIDYAYFWGTSIDGTLAFSPIEGALGEWVSEGVIPTIPLGENIQLLDAVSGEAIEEKLYFDFFMEKDGVFEKEQAWEQASFSELYLYCTENFSGETVYISFHRNREVKEAGQGDAMYTYVFCAKIP